MQSSHLLKAEMATSNRIPSRKQDGLAVFVPQKPRVYVDGHDGGVDLSSFQRIAIDEVPAMAANTVSFDQVATFAQCAAQGGSGIQKVVQGTGMQCKFSHETFTDIVKTIWFDEDWPPLMQSQCVTHIAHNAVAGNLDLYQGEVQKASLCVCPPNGGLTLAGHTQFQHCRIQEFQSCNGNLCLCQCRASLHLQ